MLTQQSVNQFAHNLQQRVPFIEAMQILTSDGLLMHADTPHMHEDTISALTAALYSAAQNLARYLDSNTPQGMIICMGDYSYAVARVNDDCVMGFQVPMQMSTPQALQTVCDFIDANEHQLRVIH